MRESVFVEQYEKEWALLADYLHYKHLSARARRKANLAHPPLDDADFPASYRRLCNQLALAETRHFSQNLIERLNRLVVDGHSLLYQHKGLNWRNLAHFVMHTFPAAVRREKVMMLWATAFFVLPALVTFLIVQFFPTAAYSFIDESQLRSMEYMYEPDDNDRLGQSRDADSDVLMFGVYIMNNISIALRSFASGLLAGVGSIFVAVFNGGYLGVIFSHLQNAGYAFKTLYPFVITHGAFELTAIVISSGAGLRLGLSLLLPGRYSRGESIARAAKSLVPIVIGFVLMLVLAAFIEAFWSAINMPAGIKYAVGSACWVLVFWYFIFAGRRHEP